MSRAKAKHASGRGGPGLAPGPIRTVTPRISPDQRTEMFLELSEVLTGFGQVPLRGTGVADVYLRELDAILPAGMLDELLDAFRRLPGGADREAAAESAVFGDPKLGPVARAIILLWYRGTWSTLPEDWRAAYGASPLDTDHVVSAETYQAGLQWTVAGAHPAGARPQGFGAWAEPPEDMRP